MEAARAAEDAAAAIDETGRSSDSRAKPSQSHDEEPMDPALRRRMQVSVGSTSAPLSPSPSHP